MFRDELVNLIRDAVHDETITAKKEWGEKYNSLHEGYAVLKEEIEEARDDKIVIQNHFYNMWGAVKVNDSERVKHLALQIRDKAVNLAMEAVQIAAVCNKIINSV